MPIKMIRIDDRLIHGQIVTAWAKAIQASKIWIIDDGVAKDDFIKGVMQMVAPSDRELIISGLSEMPTLLEKVDDAPENTLILVKFPYVAKEIFKVGPKLKELKIVELMFISKLLLMKNVQHLVNKEDLCYYNQY